VNSLVMIVNTEHPNYKRYTIVKKSKSLSKKIISIKQTGENPDNLKSSLKLIQC